jgi:hypothetical protein
MEEQAAAPQPSTDPPPPRERRGRGSALRERIDAVLDWMEGAGFGFSWGERLVYWWKHFGLAGMLLIVVAVGYPMARFVWIPSLASGVVTGWLSAKNLDVEIEDWSAAVFDLRATAHDVRISTQASYGRPEVMRASAVTLDMSIWQRLFSDKGWIESIEIEGPSIYVERLLSGRWNWEDLLDPGTGGGQLPPLKDDVQLASSAQRKERTGLIVPRLKMRDLRIQWVENLPGDSGGGLIRSSKATIYIDDVNLLAQNFYAPRDRARGATPFAVEGRTADGRVSIRGAFDPDIVDPTAPRAGGPYLTGFGNRRATLTTSVYFENVGAATLASILYPASITPSSGTVSGRVDVTLYDSDVRCETDLVLRNVTWSADAESPHLRVRHGALRRELDTVSVTSRIKAKCDGDLETEGYRPLWAAQGAVTREALKDAPPVVRAAANLDARRLTGEKTMITPADFRAELSSELKRAGREAVTAAVDQEMARLLGQPRQTGQPQQSNLFSRGLNRIRSWF